MPHDKHGRLIQVGDFVKAPPYNYGEDRSKPKSPVVGRVVAMREGQTCSGDFSWVRPWHGVTTDAFGAEESELVLKADGSEPEPPKAKE